MAAWLKKYWRRIVGLVFVLGGGSAAAVLFLRPPQVPTVRAARHEVVQTVVASGRVLSAARVQLAALRMGRIVEINGHEGDRVTSGALLVRLDEATELAELRRAEAIAQQARARLAEARGPNVASAAETLTRAEHTLEDQREDLARLETAARGGGVAGQELEHARAQIRLRESEVESAGIALRATRGVQARGVAADLTRAEADVLAARTRLAQLRILAPADGVLVTRAAEMGDVVSAGQILLELVVDGPVEVRIDPDESTLALLEPGQPALISPDAFPDRQFSARVASIAPTIDAQRGTIEVRLEVPTPPAELRTDMTVSVDVEVARRPNALVLPAGCVRGVGSDSPWVLLVVDGRTVRRDVRLGAIGDDTIEVLEGIEEGDHAISLETSTVDVGTRVRDGGAP